MDLENCTRSERVYLKPVEAEDLEQRVAWINDPVVQKTLNYPIYPVSLARMKKWFDSINSDFTRRDFSIFTKDHEYIGFCGIFDIDDKARKAEFYTTIGKTELWNQGYGAEIYKLTVRYGFEELGLNRMYGYILNFNKASLRVIEKLGIRVEGVLREDGYSHGETKDRAVIAILRKEWEALPENRK